MMSVEEAYTWRKRKRRKRAKDEWRGRGWKGGHTDESKTERERQIWRKWKCSWQSIGGAKENQRYVFKCQANFTQSFEMSQNIQISISISECEVAEEVVLNLTLNTFTRWKQRAFQSLLTQALAELFVSFTFSHCWQHSMHFIRWWKLRPSYISYSHPLDLWSAVERGCSKVVKTVSCCYVAFV